MQDFERTCDMWAETLLKKIFGEEGKTKGNYNSFIIVDSGGLTGLGKTTFSVQLSKAICKRIKFTYSRKELMILDPSSDKIEEKIKSLPIGCPVHVDEAILVAYNRDFMNPGNKDLNKFFSICRKWKKILIFNIPDFYELDAGILKKADYRALAVVRGRMQVFSKWINPHSPDKWKKKYMEEKVEPHIKNVIDFDGVINANRTTKLYTFDILYDDLPEKEYKEYEEESLLREMKSYEFQMMDKWKLRFGVLLRGLVKHRNLSLNDIMSIMNERLQGYARYWRVKPEDVLVSRDMIKEWSKSLSTLVDEEVLVGGTKASEDIYYKRILYEDKVDAAPENKEEEAVS